MKNKVEKTKKFRLPRKIKKKLDSLYISIEEREEYVNGKRTNLTCHFPSHDEEHYKLYKEGKLITFYSAIINKLL
jgi:hypothetical protein